MPVPIVELQIALASLDPSEQNVIVSAMFLYN